jgi:ATP-dependent RNA helicase DeaD
MTTFSELGLKPEILKALDGLGFEFPTEIQQKSIPQIIGSQDDLKAFAQTGTGKTAAFSLPIIELIDPKKKGVQAIILSPTRELAVQIGNNINEFTKYLPGLNAVTVYGGSNIEDQIRKIKKRSSNCNWNTGKNRGSDKQRGFKVR